MADDELIDQLKRWGSATVARFAANDDGPSNGPNVLARQRDFALASKRKREEEREIVGRDGRDRRRFMAERSGVKGLGMTPLWAVDPVRSSNDADAPRDHAPIAVAVVDLLPDELHWIERALARLTREHRIRALIIREEFCGVGTHERKAAAVRREYGGALTVRQYRYELQRALDWMRGSMAA